MGSRKEEERNERIIRGLMKLPPNRRCINCNGLGPQYVCTNFWTFVCMTCSGIHREFTHRVKSVSMAKFTFQEVEALQNGGNQRAREIYLKDWDFQRQRLPVNSNVEKIREFIKNVYVDRKYAGGRTSEKPPRDMQSLRIHEDETRRASSYHSYSQSPPYDYQYEDRKYGKQAASLTRKPGSDRGRYEGKVSGSVFSPGRLSDQTYDDRFANEGYASRVSDFSVSSGGDPFRSGAHSPNFQKDSGFSSPPFPCARDMLNDDTRHQISSMSAEANGHRDAYGISRPQRTMSSGSFGSIDSNSTSLKSYNSAGVTDGVLEPETIAHNNLDKMPTSQQSSVPGVSISLSFFEEPFAPKPVSAVTSSVDLFQSQASLPAPPVDLFQLSSASPSFCENQPQQRSPPPQSLQFFPETNPQHPATLDKMPLESAVPKNEGWATFDSPQTTSSVHSSVNVNAVKNPSNESAFGKLVPPSNEGALGKFDPFVSSSAVVQWPSTPNYSAYDPSLLASSQWHTNLPNAQVPAEVMSTDASWNAFEDAITDLSLQGGKQNTELQVPVQEFLPSSDGHLFFGVTEGERGTQMTSGKSTNPFDLPYDPDMEQTNMFLDMSSLQSALPNAQLPSSLVGGSQPWFSQNPAPFIPTAAQGGLSLMAGQAPGSQISNITPPESVASIGGNPFA
ncbi:hypothetical protein IC582_009053 [Cucumis melo]|uniref:Probable ADP-ribosylation factor GTPase-activating protein AGD14 isoform X1 n=2 Tax=Cucumis melo TaxID=3656 RepID=A0A1S3B6Z1_CUCME|nr:probable ADP-ribosylation factor GTPase-activating protein AGD14 isoform X1 [Cucumis melo]